MIEVTPHGLWHWCTLWPDGLSGRLKGVWAPCCRMHDIMGTLTELPYGEEVLCEGEIFSWPKLGFDEVPSQQWQDAWLKGAILAIARFRPGISDDDRKQIRGNAEVMYTGLRTLGVPFRAIA